MTKICLIPAREGSKRIKNKNIKKFFGKEVIFYSIDKAFKSKLFDYTFKFWFDSVKNV